MAGRVLPLCLALFQDLLAPVSDNDIGIGNTKTLSLTCHFTSKQLLLWTELKGGVF